MRSGESKLLRTKARQGGIADEVRGTSPREDLGQFPCDYERDSDEENKYLVLSDDSNTESTLVNGSRKTDPTRSHRRKPNHCRLLGTMDSSDSEGDCYEGDETSDSDLDSDLDIRDPALRTHKQKMRRWKKLARGKFEEMLLECIVNTDNIPPNYENIFLNRKTIAQVEKVTKLGLTRPKAFSHGVLKNNKVTGAVLYGPPGTGKTLLARGVAKQAGFNMLSISTAEVWQKCHGEDEKMIQAVFSIARKMYPTIIFLDEADAMLGERKAGEKRHLRAMLNKFLMEWDGIMSGANSPFVLLATNRPNDLDPAVLRRAPVRIPFDLPSSEERRGILNLLLKNERLDDDMPIPTLANLTPQYTGSDLKNLCVTAATECISEQSEDTTERILERRHFLSAMQIVKATTISKTREQDFHNFGNNRQEQAEE
ncbi:P-loop containing nucleoside triphosphate hydrolase protein [Aspergillus novoparasiticus]|uniref:P-loop containing nucleoside triphosphate hydrolase protein n=1 Tax=Aspergillus novoparasiticus TaxID=986946 RepID=A0A5N6ESN9_9EURO|nr:P-loop containing nucleoside triphosphate hydrolase protein [Aspergillus novoparasiticus]